MCLSQYENIKRQQSVVTKAADLILLSLWLLKAPSPHQVFFKDRSAFTNLMCCQSEINVAEQTCFPSQVMIRKTYVNVLSEVSCFRPGQRLRTCVLA